MQGQTSGGVVASLTSAGMAGLKYFRFIPEQIDVAAAAEAPGEEESAHLKALSIGGLVAALLGAALLVFGWGSRGYWRFMLSGSGVLVVLLMLLAVWPARARLSKPNSISNATAAAPAQAPHASSNDSGRSPLLSGTTRPPNDQAQPPELT